MAFHSVIEEPRQFLGGHFAVDGPLRDFFSVLDGREVRDRRRSAAEVIGRQPDPRVDQRRRLRRCGDLRQRVERPLRLEHTKIIQPADDSFTFSVHFVKIISHLKCKLPVIHNDKQIYSIVAEKAIGCGRDCLTT